MAKNEITQNVSSDKNVKKKYNIFSKVKNVFTKEEADFTAERAWLESTYGIGANLSDEERISNKQNDIISTIKSKFRCVCIENKCRSSYSSYHCVIDIEEDLASFKDVIFKPFIEKGFKVINLSKQVDEIEDENIYLISWKHIFKKS